MVMPIYDHSPFRWPTPPYVTWLLIAANVAVFFLQAVTATDHSNPIDQAAALVPAALTSERTIGSMLAAAPTLVSYMFLHANFMHIFGNMIFLWVFGDDVEEAIGHVRFLAFYLACGIGGGLAFALSDPGSKAELVGASGAVAGVVVAYLMFRPCAKVTVLVSIFPLRVRAFWVIGGWAAWQFVEATNRAQDGIAYWAHIGGLATGVILFVLMRPAGVRLFQCIDPEGAETARVMESPR